jgi:hypothetical protein
MAHNKVQFQKGLNDNTWIEQIEWQALDSHPQKWQDEDYGVAWSRRIWPAADSRQVELTFAPLSWANVDPAGRGDSSSNFRRMPNIV